MRAAIPRPAALLATRAQPPFSASASPRSRPDEAEPQMRWQAFTSLGYGARGVLYFCYWSPTGASFPWGGAMMVPRALPGGPAVFQPGPKLAQAARINAKLAAFGNFVLPAAHAGVFVANGTGASSAAVPSAASGGALAAIGGSGAGPTWAALVGAYASPGAGWASAVLLQNQDWVFPAVLNVTFTPQAPAAWELDPATGSIAPAWDDAPALPGFQLYVDAGDARLLVFPAAN